MDKMEFMVLAAVVAVIGIAYMLQQIRVHRVLPNRPLIIGACFTVLAGALFIKGLSF